MKGFSTLNIFFFKLTSIGKEIIYLLNRPEPKFRKQEEMA